VSVKTCFAALADCRLSEATNAADTGEASEVVISLSVLPDSERVAAPAGPHPSGISTINLFEPFWVEATILNSTRQTQDLVVEIPERSASGSFGLPSSQSGGAAAALDQGQYRQLGYCAAKKLITDYMLSR
jgi:hypothetical protein